MRRAIILPLFAAVLAFIYSCGKDGKASTFSQSSAQLIAGKWSLQQEKVVQYVDGVVRIDTTYNTASNNVATVQFNKNGTFSSMSLYSSNESYANLNPSNAVTTADSTSGVFNFAGTKFSVSAPLAGLGSGSIAFSGTTISATSPMVFSSVSNSTEITKLTSNRLSLHTENIYSLTSNNITQTYKNECDYYYTR